jgi:hypothetical protein
VWDEDEDVIELSSEKLGVVAAVSDATENVVAAATFLESSITSPRRDGIGEMPGICNDDESISEPSSEKVSPVASVSELEAISVSIGALSPRKPAATAAIPEFDVVFTPVLESSTENPPEEETHTMPISFHEDQDVPESSLEPLRSDAFIPEAYPVSASIPASSSEKPTKEESQAMGAASTGDANVPEFSPDKLKSDAFVPERETVSASIPVSSRRKPKSEEAQSMAVTKADHFDIPGLSRKNPKLSISAFKTEAISDSVLASSPRRPDRKATQEMPLARTDDTDIPESSPHRSPASALAVAPLPSLDDPIHSVLGGLPDRGSETIVVTLGDLRSSEAGCDVIPALTEENRDQFVRPADDDEEPQKCIAARLPPSPRQYKSPEQEKRRENAFVEPGSGDDCDWNPQSANTIRRRQNSEKPPCEEKAEPQKDGEGIHDSPSIAKGSKIEEIPSQQFLDVENPRINRENESLEQGFEAESPQAGKPNDTGAHTLPEPIAKTEEIPRSESDDLRVPVVPLTQSENSVPIDQECAILTPPDEERDREDRVQTPHLPHVIDESVPVPVPSTIFGKTGSELPDGRSAPDLNLSFSMGTIATDVGEGFAIGEPARQLGAPNDVVIAREDRLPTMTHAIEIVTIAGRQDKPSLAVSARIEASAA